MYLGMSFHDANAWGFRGRNEGSKLAGNSDLWKSGNLINNDSAGTSGFIGIPGGFRDYMAGFYNLQEQALWWSSTKNPDDDVYATTHTLYYDNAKAERFNSRVTSGLSVRCVKMVESETITDVQGNIYPIVKIGNQTWMATNMRTICYPNGDSIEFIYNDSIWELLDSTSEAYTRNWNEAYPPDSSYGLLYTWAAAVNYDYKNPDSYVQGICPDGWHLPSDDEWKKLEMECYMSQEYADKTGFRGKHYHVGSILSGPHSAWYNSRLESTSFFGFSGFKAEGNGFRSHNDGRLNPMYYNGFWWSATETGNGRAMSRNISTRNTQVNRNDFNKANGFSVRCLKNE